LIYFNSLDASWHLDDYQNIVQDTRIHLTDCDLASIIEYVKSVQLAGRDARPLSRFSFAVNWFFGRNDPFGYHLINIVIHILCSFFLYGTILSIRRTPNFRFVSSARNYYKISLLAALLWAINPIQTQAVTYIVQRMAALAAMFYILAMYLYIKARTSDNSAKRNLIFFSCFLSGVCAFASKENAATLPIALLLVEFLFFQDLSRKKIRNIYWGATLTAGLAMAGLGVVIFFKGDFQGLLNYNFRYFSPVERLLTEPRVVLYYLSQIFYPVPTRLSIEHDIAVSTSLFSPWTTLPAIILVCSLIGIGLYNVKRRPMLGFAVLFFFLNHVIESSVIGLELVFEHRNYLPSFFLFVPVAAGIMGLLDYYRKKNKLIHHAIVTFVVLIIAGFGAGTYIRNLAWQSEKSLWEDAVVKAPNSVRAWHNLALSHYAAAGRFEEAILLYRKALTLEKNNIHQESLIYSNMAASFYYQGDYQQAAQYCTKALSNRRTNPKVKYLLCLALIRMGDYETASKNLEQLASGYPQKAEVLNLSGILAVLQGNHSKGLAYFKRCFRLKSRLPAVLVNAGVAHCLRGDYQKAERFFKTYLGRQPNDNLTLLWLAQNSMVKGDWQQAESYLNRLLRIVPVKDLITWVRNIEGRILYKDTMIVPHVDTRIMSRLSQSSTDR
jgi:tetratricopeptide (TPR) repeat protein